MLTSQFTYHLPEHLIAKYPTKERTASRLLYLDGQSGKTVDCDFARLTAYLQPNDLLVLNNSKVLHARLLGQKASGGKVELLIERVLNGNEALAQIRSNKPMKPGSQVILAENITAEVIARDQDLFKIKFLTDVNIFAILDQIGQVPLPPYMARAAETCDQNRYQTVYALHPGSVAAPTAGLHFDQSLLTKINDSGVAIQYITLHVGAGTFQPVRVDNITQHRMHAEYIAVDAELCAKIAAVKASGGRVIAVGTTTARALESAALSGKLQAYHGDTAIFIYPGFNFKVVDALITNFHLPMSTLLMLTCAFAGTANVLRAYQHAIEQQYRFYSYGDAMFITRGSN